MPARRPWTCLEVRYLRQHAMLGAVALAAAMGRSRYSVEKAAVRFDVSLRRRDELRGRIAGQGRGQHISAEMRAALLHVRRVRDPAVPRKVCEACGRELAPDLCPWCGRRPIASLRTGLCRVCSAQVLREAYENQLTKCELDAMRQRRHREGLAERPHVERLALGPQADVALEESARRLGGPLA